MDRDQIIATLRAHRAELEAMGVRHAALFGSYARGEAGPESDIDVAVEFESERYRQGMGYFGASVRVHDYLRTLFPQPVDMSDIKMMRDYVARDCRQDRCDVF